MSRFLQVPLWLLEGYPSVSIKAKLFFSIVSDMIMFSQFEDEHGQYYYLSPQERIRIGALVDCKGSSIGRLFKELRDAHLLTTYQHGTGVRMYLVCEVDHNQSTRSIKNERPRRSNTSDPLNQITKPNILNYTEGTNIYNSAIMNNPKFTEVLQYFKERGFTSNPLKFFEYYEKQGWIVSGRPVRNWKALADRWDDNEHVLLPSQFYTYDVIRIMESLPQDIQNDIISDQQLLNGEVRKSTYKRLLNYNDDFQK